MGCCDIWAAWRNFIDTRKYLKGCLEWIVDVADKYDCKWYTIGELTKKGH